MDCMFSIAGGFTREGGGGLLPYITYIGMCRCEGHGFQAVPSGIGYRNQEVWSRIGYQLPGN